MNEKELLDKAALLTYAYTNILSEFRNVKLNEELYSAHYRSGYSNFLAEFIVSMQACKIEEVANNSFGIFNFFRKKNILEKIQKIVEACLSYIHNLDINPKNRRELSEDYLKGNAAGWQKIVSTLEWIEK